MNEKLVPVKISPDAVQEIRKIMSQKNIPADYYLRVGMKGNVGCGGMGYLLGFDHPKEHDNIYEIEGIPVVVEKKHVMYILDLTIDYHHGADASGFVFRKNDS
ncbi:MAG: HesB/IscA family protein [Candidatus Cyclobacteriaceae bacterium M3_2C_046]